MHEHTIGEQREEFKGYVDRMTKIRLLSSPQTDEMTTADFYSAVLVQNFRDIGALAEENRSFIGEELEPILRSEDLLPDELVSEIRELNENLIDAVETQLIDLPMAVMLNERLRDDAERKQDPAYIIRQLDKEIETNYLQQNMTGRITSAPQISESFKMRAIRATKEILTWLDKERFLTLDEECRTLVMVNSRYGAAVYENGTVLDAENCAERIRFLLRALKIAEDPFYHEALPDYDWRFHFFRIYEYFSRTDFRGADEETKRLGAPQVAKWEELWRSDPAYFGRYRTYPEVAGSVWTALFDCGVLSAEEYRDRLHTLFPSEEPYEYSSRGQFVNLELPMFYLRSLPVNGVVPEEFRAEAEQLYRSAVDYAFHIPKLGLFSTMLDSYCRMLEDFTEIPGGITFEELSLSTMAAFHPPTYVHSLMVADLSRLICERLMDRDPALFVGILGADTPETVTKKRKALLDFTYHAALCHDFGKIPMIDTIFIYGRRLLDFEYDLIRQHAELGASFLRRHASTASYADIARLHHCYYDGSGGYPADQDLSGNPLRTVISVVTCADCLDAATDTVGRSYNRGKTLADFTGELLAGSGTRYAPYLSGLFEDASFCDALTKLLGEGRRQHYRDTWQLLCSLKEDPQEITEN
ncbi:MAG: HD domain-containing protein [Lachnospiraceae bacterium]|nr:HD domain-containing protein [Lachnospiraceae bacterium]